MDNDREIDSVLMNIEKTSGGVVAALTFSARMSFAILSFLFRLAKKGMVSTGLCDNFKNFMAKTEGDFATYNIPLSDKSAQNISKLQKLELELENTKNPLTKASIRNEIKSLQASIPELEQLKKLNIDCCVLPKLNGSDNTIQIAVARKSDENFKNWFLNHLTTEMKGGEKSLEVLKVFTEGNYSVMNMPFEETEELAIMLSDFNTMGINYSILPDLNIGDGYTQVAIPNSEREQVKQWFSLWKEKALAEGKETQEMYTMNEDAYTATSEIKPDEYIKGADEGFRVVQEEFEQISKPVPWKASLASDSSPEYVRLLNDEQHVKITINEESLVNHRKKNDVSKKFEEEGYFVSRIPYTYGEKQQELVLPRENVFKTDEGKTVIAFLNKTKSYHTISSDGVIENLSTDEIFKKYKETNRRFAKVEDYTKVPTVLSKVAEEVPTVVPLPVK